MFVFLKIVFGCDNPTYYASSGRGIEFAHLIFRYLRPCKTLVFARSTARTLGLPISVRSLRIVDLTYNPSHSTINCGRAEWLGACNTCVRLQSRVTTSGTTVDGLFLFVCLCMCLFFCLFVRACYFVCFYFILNFFFSRILGMGRWGWKH